MEESLKNSANYLRCKMLCLSSKENYHSKSLERGTSHASSRVEGSQRGSKQLHPEGKSCPEIYPRINSAEYDYEQLLEDGNISPSQETPSTEVSGDESSEDDCFLSDGSIPDDDHGGDFTVSKYMQSKISREEEGKFGVWRVERIEVQPADNMTSCVGGSSDVAGPSGSSEGPPLKLTLKKSHKGVTEEQKPPKDVKTKRKYKKRTPKEPKDPQKRRGPGRPPSNNPTSVSARQRLMKMFKKKYFKDRKRWARKNSTYSMPPTIRSIAKP